MPLKFFSCSDNKAKIGVVGIGGLGHMALQFGRAMGCEMFAISHSAGKKDECLNTFKASQFIDSSKKDELESISQKAGNQVNFSSMASL